MLNEEELEPDGGPDVDPSLLEGHEEEEEPEDVEEEEDPAGEAEEATEDKEVGNEDSTDPGVQETLSKSDHGQEPVEKPSEAKPALKELKILIIMKGSEATIGVDRPNCDPVWGSLSGTMTEILAHVEAFAAEAITKWDSQPRDPKCVTPLPSHATPTPRATTANRAPAKPPATSQKALF